MKLQTLLVKVYNKTETVNPIVTCTVTFCSSLTGCMNYMVDSHESSSFALAEGEKKILEYNEILWCTYSRGVGVCIGKAG